MTVRRIKRLDFLAACTAVNTSAPLGQTFRLFLAACTAVNLSLVTYTRLFFFLAACTAVN